VVATPSSIADKSEGIANFHFSESTVNLNSPVQKINEDSNVLSRSKGTFSKVLEGVSPDSHLPLASLQQ